MRKISIITPSYNQGNYLEQTIDSVLSQNYPNLEYIIIDGGSTDNSVEIIKKYQKHLHYWVSQKDSGQSEAINKGLKIAGGDIINWLNSDDYYTANALKTVAEHFEDESVLVVSGRSDIWKNEKILVQSSGTDIYSTVEKTIGWARIDQPETFFRNTAVEKMGLLNIQLHYVMDREWWIRYLMYFGTQNIKKTDSILVNFRIHEHSKTNSAPLEFIQETINVYYTLAKAYKLEEAELFSKHLDASLVEGCGFPDSMQQMSVRKAIHYFWFLQASVYYAQNNYAASKKYIPLINANFLSIADVKELEKIKMRIKLLPAFVKKILNKNR
jgi:glycosyltransferase involved in cell wall biosynthesis